MLVRLSTESLFHLINDSRQSCKVCCYKEMQACPIDINGAYTHLPNQFTKFLIRRLRFQIEVFLGCHKCKSFLRMVFQRNQLVTQFHQLIFHHFKASMCLKPQYLDICSNMKPRIIDNTFHRKPKQFSIFQFKCNSFHVSFFIQSSF